MNLDNFSQRIEKVRQRSQFLESRAGESPIPQQNALLEAIEQLNTALEELYVAEEELHQQNEQLNIANQQVEK